MYDHYSQKHQWLSHLIYLLVLGTSFYVSCSILAIHSYENLVFLSVFYAFVILAFIRLGQFILPILVKSKGWITHTVLANAVGLMLGVVFLVGINFLLPNLAVSIIAIVLSSVIAFFILGTLAPLLLTDRRSSAR